MKKEQIDKIIKSLEETYKRPLTEEEIKQMYSRFGNPKAKDIELRDGEIDYTELNSKKQFQLTLRELHDLNERVKYLNQTTNDLYVAFLYFLKLKGVNNPLKEIEDFSNDIYDKMKKGE